MARPAFDKKIQLDIEHLHGKHPLWKAPRMQKELIAKYGKQAPSSSYIRNKLKEIRCQEAKGSVLDQPWSLASLTIYSVPYDILPWLNWLAEDMRKRKRFITIRGALWIGRLSVLPSEDKAPNRRTGETVKQWEQRLNRYLSRLLETSHHYVAYEKGCERVGLTPVDSSEFDGSSLEQTYKNFDRYYYGTEDDVTPLPQIANRIEKAWIRYQQAGKPVGKGGESND